MNLVAIIDTIGSLFNEQDRSVVLAALREDNLVWKAVTQTDLIDRAREQAGDQPEMWSPGCLGLIALEFPGATGLIRDDSTRSLSNAWREKAVRFYEETRRKGHAPETLAEAALLALALRERRRVTGAWSGFISEMVQRGGANPDELFVRWATPLACLFGMVREPAVLLRTLIETGQVGCAWAVHAVLSNPIQTDSAVGLFQESFRDLSIPVQLEAIELIRLWGRHELAARLSARLIHNQLDLSAVQAPVKLDDLRPHMLASRALSLFQAGVLYEASGNSGQSKNCLNAACATLEYWLTGITLRESQAQGESGLPDGNLLKVGGQKKLERSLGALVSKKASAGANWGYQSSLAEDPILMMAQARNYSQAGERALAQDLARKAVARFMDQIQATKLPSLNEFSPEPGHLGFLHGLIELGLQTEATQAAEAMLERTPNDIDLLSLASRLEEMNRRSAEAIQMAKAAYYLKPNDTGLKRRLMDVLETAGQVEDAFALAMTGSGEKNVGLHDRIGQIRLAYKTGRLEDGKTFAEAVIHEHPERGDAYGWFGMVQQGRGENDLALQSLSKATLLEPESAMWWLEMAKLNRRMGRTGDELDTLRAAATALPESGEILLALGEAELRLGMTSDALPVLKKAKSLAPENVQIGLRLGQVQRKLGHVAEARMTLDSLKSKWLEIPEAAYESACAAMDAGDMPAALSALRLAVQSSDSCPEWIESYVRVLLGAERVDEASRRKGLEEAQGLLETVETQGSERYQTRYLLAETLRALGKNEEAIEKYRGLLESGEVKARGLEWEIHRGIGLAARQSGQVEAALASLREAAALKPGELSLQHDLAETCWKANLDHDAMRAAETALSLAPNRLDNLMWFAEKTSQSGNSQRARDALKTATEISPERFDLRAKLAQMQLETGYLDDAKDTLSVFLQDKEIQATDLRQAAYLYLRMQEFGRAKTCLEKAVAADPAPGGEVLVELARLYEREGALQPAVDLIQDALQRGLKDIQISAFQADLLTRLNRYQAAQACLEASIQWMEADGIVDKTPAAAEIYTRMARLLKRQGNLPAALGKAEKAVRLMPTNLGLRLAAAELAGGLMRWDSVHSLLQEVDEVVDGTGNAEIGMRFLCMQAEEALIAGRVADAKSAVQSAKKINPLATWPKALEIWAAAKAGEKEIAMTGLREIGSDPMDDQHSILAVARASLEMGQLKAAISGFEAYTCACPNEPAGHFELARAIVRCAETQRDYVDLGVQKHGPGAEFLSERRKSQFEQEIQSALEKGGTAEVLRWEKRGQAVFEPSLATLGELTAVALDEEDAGAVVAAFRHSGNPADGARVGMRFLDQPETRFQVVLCAVEADLEVDPDLGDRLVEIEPGNPLAHAALAKLAMKQNQEQKACLAVQETLRYWPDESNWQATAAELSWRLENYSDSIDAWKAAQSADPHNASYAIHLGQACQAAGRTEEARSAFEKAVQLAPAQLDAWVELAQVQREMGDWAGALESAGKASELEGAAVEAKLLASQIALQMGNLEKAKTYATDAARRQPRSAGVVLAMSKILSSQRKSADGLTIIESALGNIEGTRELLVERARLTCEVKGAKEAYPVVVDLAARYPDDSDALGLLFEALFARGEVKEALQVAHRALRIDPQQPKLAFKIGKLERDHGQLDQAVFLLSEAVKMEPTNIDYYLELAQTYSQRREHQLALQVYRQASKVNPKDARPFFQAGLILRDSKDYSEAESMLQHAARLAPEDLNIHRNLVSVMALNLIHRTQEASTAL